jgi:nitroreductase
VISRRGAFLGGGVLALGGGGAAYASWRNMGSMGDYDAAAAAARVPLSARRATRELIRFATLAANSHNSQPWLFNPTNVGIDIAPDFRRRLPAVDPDNHHLFASLGCAAENLAIAAADQGRGGELVFAPANGGAVSFRFGTRGLSAPAMLDAIPKRQSTRGDYDGRSVNVDDLATLAQAGALPGVDLILITDRRQIDQVSDLVVSANTAQMDDPKFVRELKAWLRFNPRRAMETGDGLFAASSGNPILPDWLGPLMFDVAFKAARENEKYARQIASSAGIAVFAAQENDAEHWVLAGRACQRFALQATALGIKSAFINQPVEVARFRPELTALIGLPGRRPDIVMRFGYGPALPYSSRRPVDSLWADNL